MKIWKNDPLGKHPKGHSSVSKNLFFDTNTRESSRRRGGSQGKTSEKQFPEALKSNDFGLPAQQGSAGPAKISSPGETKNGLFLQSEMAFWANAQRAIQ
jgi:hypothetical protein